MRSIGFTRVKVEVFFDNYVSVSTKYGFMPENTFNLDETVLKPTKVVSRKERK